MQDTPILDPLQCTARKTHTTNVTRNKLKWMEKKINLVIIFKLKVIQS